MISKIIRILIGIIGLMSVFAALQHLFSLDSIAAERGLSTLNTAGRANFRADIAGMFMVIGASHLVAAWKQSPTWAFAAASIIGLALLGRVISLALDGSGAGVWPPIVIEAVCMSLSLIAWRLWQGK
jgi:Domain of unknown function (DUF4345)